MQVMTPVGLGTFPFSNVFSSVSPDEAARIVHRFLELGGRYIQTAPYYEGVDDLMGSILSAIPRSEYAIGTLCVKDRESRIQGSRSAVFAQCEDSLKRLKCDHLDYYLTSTPAGSDVPLGESIAAMAELKASGLVRHIGVCNVTVDELRAYQQGGQVEIVENRFSLIDQEQDRDVRQVAVSEGLSLVPYNIIEWGLLTSKILSVFHLRSGDVRSQVLPVFRDEAVDLLRGWVKTYVLPVAQSRGVAIEAVTIAWAISQPGVAFAPVGATKVEQIESSMQALSIKNDAIVLAELDAAYQELVSQVRAQYGVEVNEFLRNSFGRW